MSAPPAAVSLVETDAFCECGYNLHGQKVWRDPDLELLVCRCPECGRHAAAGRFTGIHSVWLHRFSLWLIFSWVVFLLALFAFLIPMMGVWPNLDMERSVTIQPVPGQGANPTMYEWTMARDQWRYRRSNEEVVVAMVFATLNGLVLGGVASVFLWHLRRKRAFLFAVAPLVVMGVVYWGWMNMSSWPVTPEVHWHVVKHVAGYGVWQALCVVAGVVWGRAAARGVLRLLLPDRLLQHLAFMWYRDGKEPPFQKGGVVASATTPG
jgi:hypothetical protein